MAPSNLTMSNMALYQVVPMHFCWMIFGLAGSVSNSLILVVIFKSKELHTKSQFLLANMAFVDTCYGCCFVGTGIHRYIDYIEGTVGSSFVCVLRSLPLILFGATSMGFKMALSIDRFLALAHPVYYQTRKTSDYILAFNLVIWIYSIGETSILFFGYNPALIFSICTVHSMYTKWYSTFSGVAIIFKVMVTIVVYSMSITVLSKRLMAMKNLDTFQRSAERSKLELDTFKTLMVIVAMYLITATTGFFAYLIVPQLSMELSVMIGPYVGVLFTFDFISNFFILAIMSPTFRKASKSLFTKKALVHPLIYY